MTWEAGEDPARGEMGEMWEIHQMVRHLERLAFSVRAEFCDYPPQKEPQKRRNCWAGRWWDTGPTLLGLGKQTSGTPPAQNRVLEDENLTTTSALSPRDPNGEGLPLWPAYNHTEHYLQLGLNLSVGQRLKEMEVAFWTKTLPLIMSTSGVLLGPLSSLIFLSLLLPFFLSFAPWEVIFVWFWVFLLLLQFLPHSLAPFCF